MTSMVALSVLFVVVTLVIVVGLVVLLRRRFAVDRRGRTAPPAAPAEEE
jgi:hypothetical protein